MFHVCTQGQGHQAHKKKCPSGKCGGAREVSKSLYAAHEGKAMKIVRVSKSKRAERLKNAILAVQRLKGSRIASDIELALTRRLRAIEEQLAKRRAA